MTTPVEKRNHTMFCEFHGEVGHSTDECMHLKKQIEEMLKTGKLSHLIKELKQNSGKEQPKVAKKGETSRKFNALAILMVQPWERVYRQKITQSFSPNTEVLFPPLEEGEGEEGLMIIEAKIGGHCVYCMYVDGGSASEILYEHCFNRLRPEIKSQLVPATTFLIGFIVVRSPSSYNGIIGRPRVRNLQAISSTAHEMLKILVEGGVITLKSSRLVLLECAMVFGPDRNLPATKQKVEERVKVAINPEYPEQTVMIGFTLSEEGRNKLCDLLQRNLDIFSWKPADKTGVPRHIAKHCLNIREGCSPKGYHQIQMAKEDEEKTAFITSQGIFCYTNMPFGLRNAGATYQCLTDKAFHKQIGRNLEVYVDDLVIKSHTEDEIVRDIEETFKTLRKINMKLNLKKCTFGVEEGMFLGYTVNTKGLKVCPDKVDAVLTKAEEAFKQMKQLIAELPMLTAPMEKEELVV
nr:reverse transcriptase domain-containing protein [Tanacetum cinerariifolium]